MENSGSEIVDLVFKNFSCCYILKILVFTILIRLIMSSFKAFGIRQGEADEEGGRKFSAEWSWGQAFRATFGGFGHHRNIDDYWLTVILGSVELYAYPILINLNLWVYIGAWLGIKTASTWGGWHKSRTTYTRFLCGNLFVLIAAVILTKSIQR